MYATSTPSVGALGGDFADALVSATRLAALAPSSHNSQPWGLAVTTAGPFHARIAAHLGLDAGDAPLLVLGLDRTRAIGSLEAHAFEMDMSCGAYLHVLLEALATHGWDAAHTYADETDALGHLLGAPWPVAWQPLAVVALRRARRASTSRHSALANRLLARVTNRGPYADGPLAASAVSQLATVSTRIDPRARFAPTVFTSDDAIAKAAAVVRTFAARDFAHDAAWRETYAFIHFSDSAARNADRGFPITQLFGAMPAWKQRLLQATLAPASIACLKHVGFTGFLARSLADLVAAGPALVSLETRERAPSLGTRLAAGGALLDLWLRATDAGLALHPVSVVLQHDDARQALEEALGARGRLFFFARIGRPTLDFPHAPRRCTPERDVVLL